MFEPDPEYDKKQEQRKTFNSFGSDFGKQKEKANTDSSSTISDYNAQFLQKTLSTNYIKLNSSSNSSQFQSQERQIDNNTFSYSQQPERSQTISMFSNAISNTFQNIPNTFSNLTKPFANNNNKTNNFQINNNFFGTSSQDDNKPQGSFNTVFGINPGPNTFSSSLSQPKSQINLNQFQLSSYISNFETKIVGAEEVIYFKIDLYSNITKNDWSVYHKYNDFYELNLIFKKYFVQAPNFPGQNFSRLGNLSELIHRKEGLNNYLREVINRVDLLTSVYCIKFLKLENHYPDISLYHPLLMYNLENELELPISCAYFYEETNLLFLGMGKPNENYLGGLLSKVKSGLSFFKKTNPQKVICGQLVIYNIIKNYQGLTHFEPLYSKPLFSECVSINYYKEKNCLCLGLNDGTVQLYKVYTTESTQESQGQFVIEAGIVSCHKAPIVGSIVNFNYGYIYTIARETYIKISELNYQTLMKEIPITKRNVTQMSYNSSQGRLILGDEGGSVYIIDLVSNVLLPQVCKIVNCQPTPICSLSCDYVENRIFVGFKGGNVTLYKLNNYYDKFSGNTNLIKVKDFSISKEVNVNQVIINGKNEMLFALSNGSVLVFTDNFNNPECKLYYIKMLSYSCC